MIVRLPLVSLLALALLLVAPSSTAAESEPSDAFMGGGWTDLLGAPLYAEFSEYIVLEVEGVLTVVRATSTAPRYSLFRSGETVLLVPWGSLPFDVIINFGQTLTCGVGEVISDPAQRVRFIFPACGE